MRHALSKISQFLPLMAPADQSNVSGGGNGDGAGGDAESAAAAAAAAAAAGGEDEDDEDGSKTLESLLADDDDEDDPFDLGEDEEENEPDTLTEEQTNRSKALGDQIKQDIARLALTEADIPDDMDWTDKASVAQFMSGQNSKMATGIISMVPKILDHAIGILVPKLESHIVKQVKGHGKQSEVAANFNELGYSGDDRRVAKTFYERALKKKMTPQKALNATRTAMMALGRSAKPSKKSDSGKSFKSDKDALDDLFGSK